MLSDVAISRLESLPLHIMSIKEMCLLYSYLVSQHGREHWKPRYTLSCIERREDSLKRYGSEL